MISLVHSNIKLVIVILDKSSVYQEPVFSISPIYQSFGVTSAPRLHYLKLAGSVSSVKYSLTSFTEQNVTFEILNTSVRR